MSHSDIYKDAALLQLTATCWSIDRKLPLAILAEVGSVDILKGRACLLDPESTVPIKQVIGRARSCIRKLTLPFPIRGCVLVPRKLIPEIQDQLSTFKNDYDCSVESFLYWYPSAITEAAEKLGELFDQLDYPSADQLKGRFRFEWRYLTVGPSTSRILPASLYQEEMTKFKELMAQGMDEETAKHEAPIMKEAQAMLRRWEAKDPEIYSLWERMNGWVYKGFDETYRALGVSFDKIYYESNTYLLGKELVQKGLDAGIFFRKEDGSVWADLTGDGLDQKLLLRGDGTSVYMTQDLGTAVQRHDEYRFDDMIYVVGNEQNYHFQVLKLILKKLGYSWADHIFHLSYGMVELPEGKMKSREGTVVDADDLIAEMVATARSVAEEAGKVDGLSDEEIAEISRMVGLGALKYFILKVDPKKTMLFDPKESIDFNGNTGPFIQYTYARIKSLQRRAEAEGIVAVMDGTFDAGRKPEAKEIELIKHLTDFGGVVAQAGAEYSPAVVAAYAYDLAKEFNQYYHDYPILKADVAVDDRIFRLSLALQVAQTLGKAMGLLGIEMPERM